MTASGNHRIYLTSKNTSEYHQGGEIPKLKMAPLHRIIHVTLILGLVNGLHGKPSPPRPLEPSSNEGKNENACALNKNEVRRG